MGGPAVLTSNGLWIATEQKNELIQFTTFGGATPIDLPPVPAGVFPQGIAAAPDGSIWISETDRVFQVGIDKKVTTYSVAGRPNGRITQGPDGAMWVTELGLDKVARIAGGQVHEFVLPAAPIEVQCGGRCPYGIAAGPDGNLWITESQLAAGDRVGRMTPQGGYTSWPLPDSGAALSDITMGPDGALWFAETRARKLGSITTRGVITEQSVDLPEHASGTNLVATGAGLIWYTPSLAPAYGDDPTSVGVVVAGGPSRSFEIPQTKGWAEALVPVPSDHGLVIDVVTYTGQVWQGTSS